MKLTTAAAVLFVAIDGFTPSTRINIRRNILQLGAESESSSALPVEKSEEFLGTAQDSPTEPLEEFNEPGILLDVQNVAKEELGVNAQEDRMEEKPLGSVSVLDEELKTTQEAIESKLRALAELRMRVVTAEEESRRLRAERLKEAVFETARANAEAKRRAEAESKARQEEAAEALRKAQQETARNARAAAAAALEAREKQEAERKARQEAAMEERRRAVEEQITRAARAKEEARRMQTEQLKAAKVARTKASAEARQRAEQTLESRKAKAAKALRKAQDETVIQVHSANAAAAEKVARVGAEREAKQTKATETRRKIPEDEIEKPTRAEEQVCRAKAEQLEAAKAGTAQAITEARQGIETEYQTQLAQASKALRKSQEEKFQRLQAEASAAEEAREMAETKLGTKQEEAIEVRRKALEDQIAGIAKDEEEVRHIQAQYLQAAKNTTPKNTRVVQHKAVEAQNGADAKAEMGVGKEAYDWEEAEPATAPEETIKNAEVALQTLQKSVKDADVSQQKALGSVAEPRKLAVTSETQTISETEKKIAPEPQTQQMVTAKARRKTLENYIANAAAAQEEVRRFRAELRKTQGVGAAVAAAEAGQRAEAVLKAWQEQAQDALYETQEKVGEQVQSVGAAAATINAKENAEAQRRSRQAKATQFQRGLQIQEEQTTKVPETARLGQTTQEKARFAQIEELLYFAQIRVRSK